MRRAAHAAEQGKFIVRRPGADHDAVNTERAHGKDVKNADVEIGDLQVDGTFADVEHIAEGNDRESDQRRKQRHARRQGVQQLVARPAE